MKYLPDPIWQTRCLQFDSDACANFHCIRVTNKGKGNKSKGFEFFDQCFINLTKQYARVFD